MGVYQTHDSRINGRATTKMMAGTNDAPREYRHPTELPRSSSQNVMAYPTLKPRVSMGVTTVKRPYPWHQPESCRKAGDEPDVIHNDISPTLFWW